MDGATAFEAFHHLVVDGRGIANEYGTVEAAMGFGYRLIDE